MDFSTSHGVSLKKYWKCIKFIDFQPCSEIQSHVMVFSFFSRFETTSYLNGARRGNVLIRPLPWDVGRGHRASRRSARRAAPDGCPSWTGRPGRQVRVEGPWCAPAGGALTPWLRFLHKNNQLKSDSLIADTAPIINQLKEPPIIRIALRASSIGMNGEIS